MVQPARGRVLTRAFATYLTVLVGAALIALLTTSVVIPVADGIAIHVEGDPAVASGLEKLVGVAFWVLVTFVASAVPVRLPDGVHVAVSMAPIMAAGLLGGPTAAGWVALLGMTDLWEMRGGVVWFVI